jgi:L-aminopeptidase/D-esterase-like protein
VEPPERGRAASGSKAGSVPPRSSCQVGSSSRPQFPRGLIHPLTRGLYATHGGLDIPLLYHQPDQEPDPTSVLRNTTLGLVATNAGLTKPQVAKIADLAHDGLARGIRPAHSMRDGDTVFALTTLDNPVRPPGTSDADLTDLVGQAAADAIVLAILDAARATEGVVGWPSVAEAQAAMSRTP